MQILESLPQHVYVFAIILGVLTLAFLLFFFIPSFVVSWRLSRVIRRLRKLQGTPNAAALDDVFKKSGVLTHLWREYSHTLHEQSTTDPVTGEKVTRWRSTVPAEALFRPEIVVDTPLRSEFFRHLPGIFTGVGIIGTFYGLLLGLRAFQVSENPVVVRDSLNNLLHGVYEAFLVSAVAIALAMIVTLLEKLAIARLSGKVERVVQLLDGMFEAGAGEEYLARLVKASESSADQAVVLKDALATELKQTLVELSEKQIAAATAANAAMGERIALSLETGLKGPLADIAIALKGQRSDEWGAVQSMLRDVLSTNSRELREMFGEQITGINSLQQKTMEALQDAVVKLERMATSVEGAGQRGASAMADRLGEALNAAETRQRTMNDTMAEFVEQLRLAIARTQGETQGRLQGTLDELSTRMGTVIEALSNQVQSAAETSKTHHEALADQTTRMVGEVGVQVGVIVDGVNRSASAMADRMGEALNAAETRQRTMNDTMAEFVEQLRLAIARTQGETQGRLQGTLDELSTRMGSVIEALSHQVQSAAETSKTHHEALAGQTTRMVGEVGGQVGAIVDGVNRAVSEMKAAVDAMHRTTGDALSRLNTGAESVAAAASDFAKAGNAVSGALSKSEVVAEQLSRASASAETLAGALSASVADYAGTRDASRELMRSLESAVEHARKETYMADDVLGRIESAAAKLADAQRETDGYLERISEVIRQAHGSFSEGMTKTLGEANRDFHQQLSESVKLLRMGIQELQATLETLNAR